MLSVCSESRIHVAPNQSSTSSYLPNRSESVTMLSLRRSGSNWPGFSGAPELRLDIDFTSLVPDPSGEWASCQSPAFQEFTNASGFTESYMYIYFDLGVHISVLLGRQNRTRLSSVIISGYELTSVVQDWYLTM